MKQKFLLLAIAAMALLNSCVVVKEYQKIDLNDPDMVLGDKLSDVNIKTFHSYREAAVGADGGKTGGGCGCN